MAHDMNLAKAGQRRTYVVKPIFQLKVIAFSVLLTVGASLCVYLALNYAFASVQPFSGLGTGDIVAFQRSFRLSLLWSVAILAVIFGIESFIRSHRTAGPLHVIEKMINGYAAGDLSRSYQLRKRDELKDIVKDLEVMRDGLKKFVLQDRQTCGAIAQRLEKISSLIDQNTSSESIKQELEAIRKDLASVTHRFKI